MVRARLRGFAPLSPPVARQGRHAGGDQVTQGVRCSRLGRDAGQVHGGQGQTGNGVAWRRSLSTGAAIQVPVRVQQVSPFRQGNSRFVPAGLVHKGHGHLGDEQGNGNRRAQTQNQANQNAGIGTAGTTGFFTCSCHICLWVYIRSGADTPSRFRPLRMTWAQACARRRRARRKAVSSTDTRSALGAQTENHVPGRPS